MADSRPRGPRNPDNPTPATEGNTLLLTGARLTDGRTVDVRITDGVIEGVGTPGSLPGPASRPGSRVDLTGYLLLPAPAEPHAHHDTAFTAGEPADGPRPAPADVQRRTTEAALLQLGHGATAVRTQVAVEDAYGLRRLAAVLAARRALRGLTELTAVAVPGRLTGHAGADGTALLRDALKMGATTLGGRPDRDPDPPRYVEILVELAAEHSCPVDLHSEGHDPAALDRLAALAGGLRPGVTVGPCHGLADLPPPTAARTAERLAAAGASVVVLPQGGCVALGRRAPALPPVALLRAAGVRVAAGSGALRDAANPVGRGDPLEAAYLLATQSGADPEDAYAAVSDAARAALGLPAVRIEAGFPAELLAVRGRDLAGALSLAYSRIVVHRGRVVARTSAVREFCDAGAAPGGPPELPRQAQG